MSIATILLIVALILFVLAGIGVPVPTNLVAWGLALWVLADLVATRLIVH